MTLLLFYLSSNDWVYVLKLISAIEQFLSQKRWFLHHFIGDLNCCIWEKGKYKLVIAKYKVEKVKCKHVFAKCKVEKVKCKHVFAKYMLEKAKYKHVFAKYMVEKVKCKHVFAKYMLEKAKYKHVFVKCRKLFTR